MRRASTAMGLWLGYDIMMIIIIPEHLDSDDGEPRDARGAIRINVISLAQNLILPCFDSRTRLKETFTRCFV